MRPQDLRFAHSVGNTGFFEQQILYIPKQAQLENLLHVSISEIFPENQPLAIEYCSGNGDWVVEQARDQPDWNWIAVERKCDRVRKIWSKRSHLRLNNLLIIWGEALLFTQHYLKESSVGDIYINFPDPWPKNRHRKNRLIGTTFFAELERVLQTQGRLVLVTDEPICGDEAVKVVQQVSGFQPAVSNPYYQLHRPGYGSSYFETLWKSKGKQIRYYEFIKGCVSA